MLISQSNLLIIPCRMLLTPYNMLIIQISMHCDSYKDVSNAPAWDSIYNEVHYTICQRTFICFICFRSRIIACGIMWSKMAFWQHPIRIPSHCDWVWWHQFPLLETNHVWTDLLSPGGQGVWRGLQRGFGQQPSRSLDNMCQVVRLWLGCGKGIYSPSSYHITTCDIRMIEKLNLFFEHNW